MRRRSLRGPFCLSFSLAASPQVLAGNQALVSGIYGGTLGAGGATSAERIAFAQNPAALQPSLSGSVRTGFQLHYDRPFGVEDLLIAEAGTFCDFRRFGFGFVWRETGAADLYREQGLTFNSSLRLGTSLPRFPGTLDLGSAWTCWRSELAGAGPGTDWSQGLGAAWRMLPRFKTGVFVLGVPLPGREDVPAERVWQWGFEAASRAPDAGGRSGSPQTLRLDFRKTGSAPWRTLAALTLRPHPVIELSAGLATPPFQVSFGLNAGWDGLRWNQAMRFHRYLGRTFLSGLEYARDLGSKSD